jgi:hypothetical protein
LTAPVGLPRAAADPTLAIAPNAAPPGATAPGDTDASTAAQFSAALSLLLGGVATPVVNPNAIIVKTVPADDSKEDAEDACKGSFKGSDPLNATAIGEALQQSNAAALMNPTAIVAPTISITVPTIATAGKGSSTDPKAPRHELDLLAPEFRDRLDRVIDRMESEFGYKVEVTETFRSQARQNALFAQGRSQPGQVVTWTRASNHTAGKAADLVIDGSYDNPIAYDRLMRVAREEGLRTLGPRDPGHIELPSSSASTLVRASTDVAQVLPADSRPVIAQPAPSVASRTSIAQSLPELESAPGPIDSTAALTAKEQPVAFVAPVAAVAPVAPVASVAQVAQVATVGAQAAPAVIPSTRPRSPESENPRANTTRRAADAPVQSAATDKSPIAAIAPNAGRNDASSDDAGRRGGQTEDKQARTRPDNSAARNTAAEVLRQSRDELMHAITGTDQSASSTSSVTSRDDAGSLGHADMSERIARLLKVQDAAADRPMSQVTLRLERPDGGEDRLRVDLRGNSVSATLDVSDLTAADRMSANVKELQRTLERQGLQTDSVTVRTVARTMESSALSRAAGASVEADLQRAAPSSSSNSSNTSSRDRGTRHDEPQQRQSPDSQRQRSRREQKGDR